MKTFRSLFLTVGFALAGLAVFPGCALYDSEYPAASTVLPAATPEEVTDAARTAFTAAGFGWVGQNADSITFQRRSKPIDEVMYGNWNESTSQERVLVMFRPEGEKSYRVEILPFSVRGEDSSQDVSRRMGVFNGEYRRLLKAMRASALRSMQPAAPVAAPAPSPANQP
jgi:hypothetical protein